MSFFTKTTLVLTSAALLSGAAYAKDAPKADINKDGQVTKAEFMTATTTRFVAADTNGDGMLTKEEMIAGHEAMREARASERFSRADANGDGVITRAEHDALRAEKDAKRAEKRAEMKTRIDTDGNGTISDTERAAAKEMRQAKRQEKRAERKGKRSEKNTGEKMRGPKRDANGDGVITQAEYEAVAEAMFVRMDANGDGVLTKGEGKKRKGRKRGHK